MTVPAHDQKVTRSYTLHYPAHAPRPDSPHWRDFLHYRRLTEKTAQCAFGVQRGNDFTECQPSQDNWPKGLEVHHAIIELALVNSVDLALLEQNFPGISNPDEVGAWVESSNDLIWLCEWHHRGHAGVHVASESDYGASHYIRGLIS